FSTLTGLTPMTPAYASPEQARGARVTTASDVYSLGVLLYGLLTGHSPYRLPADCDVDELTRAICEQEPARPSQSGRQDDGNQRPGGKQSIDPSVASAFRLPPSAFRGDLDSIVLLALRKEPGERYGSVEQFSADIGRYLDGLPAQARRGTFVYRAAKYIRRYKVPVAAAALILLSLLGGISATMRQARIARGEQAKAETERVRAEEALSVADEQRRRAEQALAAVEAERGRAEDALLTAEQRRRQAEAARTEANQNRARAEDHRRRAETERNTALTQRRLADEQRQRAETQELSNRRLLYTSRMSLAQHAWDDANVGRMRDLLTPYLPQANAPDLRGFEWFYLWKLSHQEERTIPFEGVHATKTAVYSPDGRQLITICQTGEVNAIVVDVRTYDAATARELRRFAFPGAYFVAVSPDREMLGLALYGGQDIAVMSLCTGQELRKVTILSGGVSCFAFSPDGKNLVTGLSDGSLCLLDLAAGKELYRFREHGDRVFTVAVSPDGGKFVSGGNDRAARLWDLRTGKVIHKLAERLSRPQNTLFSPDGRVVVMTGSGRLTAWETDSGRELAMRFPIGRRMAFSPDGRILAVGGEDAANQAEITFLNTTDWQVRDVLKGHGNEIMSLAITPDGQQLASSSRDETTRIWNLDRTPEMTTIFDQPPGWGAFEQVALAPDGTRFLAGMSSNQTAIVQDVATGKKVRELRGHQPPRNNNFRAFAVAVSPDGRRYATGGMDTMVKIWNAETGQEIGALKTPTAVYSLRFSADGAYLAAGGANRLTLWEINGARQLAASPAHQGFVNAIRFGREGKTVFTAGADGMVRLWDFPGGQIRGEFRCSNSSLNSIALSPDEKFFVAGGQDSIARVWDVGTGRELMALRGHISAVSAVAISPDGKRLATGSHDKTVRLWDLTTGQELLAFKGHNSWICDYSVSFSADGRLLLSADWSRMVKIWRTATEQEIMARR
ncbi:MAG: PQQ-binding-like beta-propeller repeat protein, partial [Blastocatellia bacterium]